MRWLSNKCTMHQTLSARKVKNILLLQQYDQPLTGYQGTLRQLKHSLVQLTCKKKKKLHVLQMYLLKTKCLGEIH